jgi:hypothetical protein
LWIVRVPVSAHFVSNQFVPIGLGVQFVENSRRSEKALSWGKVGEAATLTVRRSKDNSDDVGEDSGGEK